MHNQHQLDHLKGSTSVEYWRGGMIQDQTARTMEVTKGKRTNKNFARAMHASRQLALLQDRSNVFSCSQCGAVNAGTLRLLNSQRGGSGESRRRARRKLDRGLMPDAQVSADAKRAF